jgi:MFS family permease
MNEVAPPRISRRRAVAITVAGLTLAGALVGALWAWLAPPIHGVVALTKRGERVKAFLGNEADHFFIAAFLLVGMLGALAVVAAVLLWQWRAHRGPAMVAALAIGSAAGAAAAAGIGAVLVHWRYGAIDIAGAPVSPEHRVQYVVEAPAVFFGHTPLQIAATILLPAATAALVYALMAVSTHRDDLGAWPPVEDPVIPPPITAESALPSAQ